MSGRITTVSKPPKLERKKRVAAYARVSSGKDAMLHSLSAQVSHYSELIQKNGDWLYAGVYADEAKTGTRDSRADFQRLIADCRAGKIDMVITKSISRFARNTVTLLQTVRDFKAWEVDIFFEEQNIVQLIYRLFLDGKSQASICRYLEDLGIPSPGGKEKWSKTTVTSILQNEKYKGDALLQKSFTVDFLEKRMKPNEGEVPQYYVEGSHPAIVDPDEWDHVQTEFARRKALGRAYSGKSIVKKSMLYHFPL